MSQGTCEQVRRWAERLIEESRFIPPQDIYFYLHVAQCDTCRGALALMAAMKPEVFPELKHATCEECQANLDVFIDYEEEQAGFGIQSYPEIWWHLVGCLECAEEYTRTRVLVQEHKRKALPLPFAPARFVPEPAPVVFKELLVQIPLRRNFLQLALPSRQTRSTYRGKPEGEHVIFDQPIPAGHTTKLSFQRATPDDWLAMVTITPPIVGSVTVTLGDIEHHGDISPQGIATISDLPDKILLAPNGPDMELRIERLAS